MLFYVFFVSFSVLFVCICVLNYCHRGATHLQLNISYHISLSIRIHAECCSYYDFSNLTDRHTLIVFANNQLDAHFFFMNVYFYYVHVSGSHVPIIRRIVSTRHLVYVNLYIWPFSVQVWMRVTYTRCIDTINSSDDGHMAARNM